MEVIRKRPIKMFEVIVPHGPYRKGDRMQPTGMYRDALLKRGIIREVKEVENRMVPEPREQVPLATRKAANSRRQA